jgi:hypothetical protein
MSNLTATKIHQDPAPERPIRPEPPAPVYTDTHPEYPFLLYNHRTRQTKAAADKQQREALAKEGFVEDPLPPEDPDELTEAEANQLQGLLAKAAKALAKLGKLSERSEREARLSESKSEKVDKPEKK